MPRYYFDIHDGSSVVDEIGQEIADLAAVRKEAMHVLPQIAFDKIPTDGDRQSFVVLVTDNDGKPVYSATLSYVGLWLLR